ncbi:MAG: hypothetical protein HY075_10430 [Deltaproteobacteria bacterium]|nr:hypothetical protein [Deltaproteobacteria bacterium]
MRLQALLGILIFSSSVPVAFAQQQEGTPGVINVAGGGGSLLDKLMGSKSGKPSIFLSPGDLMKMSGDFYRGGEDDPKLGGIDFRGMQPDSSGQYLKQIFAHDLFKLMGDPTIEKYARSKNQDPQDPVVRQAFVSEMNVELNQLFVLKTIAGLLDNESEMKKMSLAVPYERLEYAIRKVLFLDNAAMNDAVFEDFLNTRITAALKDGEETAPAKLAAIGITQEILDAFQNKLPKDADPKAILEKFKAKFDADVAQMLRAPGHSVPGLKTPAFADLSPAMIARYADLMVPPRNDIERFNRLKAKIGSDPFFFGVAWNEQKSDELLASLSTKFSENWQPVVFAGQNPMLGAAEKFPESLDAFYKYVEAKLQPRQNAVVRQRMANTWLFGYWRNRDLLNPNPPHKIRHFTDMFNPLSQFIMMTTQQELNDAYGELKYEIAAKEKNDFNIVEIKLGDSADVSTSNDTHPCALAFNKAFEKPYTEKQKLVLKELADPALTTKRFDELLLWARTEVPKASFDYAKAAMETDPACASYPAVFNQLKLHVEPDKQGTVAEDELARVRFVGMLLQNEQMQKMMIPKKSRRDTKGNIWHYFFQTRAVDYVPADNDEVRANLKDAVVMRKLADRTVEALEYAILPRYVIKANTNPFSYQGVTGFQLKDAVTDPRKWLPQVFVAPRKQKNPELVTERRLIERSSKTFERAYDIQ